MHGIRSTDWHLRMLITVQIFDVHIFTAVVNKRERKKEKTVDLIKLIITINHGKGLQKIRHQNKLT